MGLLPARPKSFTGPWVVNEKQKLKLEWRKGQKGANTLGKNSGLKKMIEKKVDKASWKERRLVRKEWDTWASNFGIRMVWGNDKIQNMTMGGVWFGGDNDTGSDEAMELKR